MSVESQGLCAKVAPLRPHTYSHKVLRCCLTLAQQTTPPTNSPGSPCWTQILLQAENDFSGGAGCFGTTCNIPKPYIKRPSLLMLHIKRDASTLKKMRFDKRVCHRITRCKAGCQCNLFMCWWKYFSGCLPPYWRKGRRKEGRKGKEGGKEERKEGGYTIVATESTHKPAADKMRTAVRNLAAPAHSVKQHKRAWKTRETENADTNFFFFLEEDLWCQILVAS